MFNILMPPKGNSRKPITQKREEQERVLRLASNKASMKNLEMKYRNLNETYMDMIDSIRYC